MGYFCQYYWDSNLFLVLGDYCTASSSDEYYSQPPVITPSAAPTYYNNSGRNTPPATYSSIPSSQSYNMHHSSSLPSEMYSRVYEPVRPYWLFRDIVESKEIWCGFSVVDSDRLERAFQQGMYLTNLMFLVQYFLSHSYISIYIANL